MASYIAINLRFAQGKCETDILRAASQCDAFRPRSLGALGQTGGMAGPKEVAFVAGWSLEPFLRKFGDAVRKRSISYSADSEEHLAYLQSVVKSPASRLAKQSPNEESVNEYETTLLDCPVLRSNALDDYEQHRKTWTWGQLELYGTFSLSVRDPGRWDWRNAYRMIYQHSCDMQDDCGLPFAFPIISLSVRTTSDDPDVTWAMLFSSSFVWLQEAKAMRGHIGPKEADENLINLAELAGALASNGRVPLRDATLRLEGSIFFNESERIMAALSSVLPISYE